MTSTASLPLSHLLAVIESEIPACLSSYDRRTGGMCVAATRIVTSFLSHFGHPSTAVATSFFAFSPGWVTLIKRDGLGFLNEMTEAALACHRVHGPFVAAAYGMPPPPGGLGYHLVALTGRTLIDGDAAQASRPDRNIIIPGPVAFEMGRDFESYEAATADLHGPAGPTRVVYLPHYGLNDHLAAPAWSQPDRTQPFIEHLIAHAQKTHP